MSAEIIDPSDILIDVYGGESNGCGAVRFNFKKRDDALRHLSKVLRWAQDESAVDVTVVDGFVEISCGDHQMLGLVVD